MPGDERDESAAPDVVAVLRTLARTVQANTDELVRLREVFEKVLSATPQRIEPAARGPVPGTVPGAQLISAGAELIRALNAGQKKKRRRDE